MINPLELTGKRILVIGGACDIGRSVSVQLSRLGASLVIVDKDYDNLKTLVSELDENSVHTICPCDFYDNSRIAENVKDIVNKFGLFDGFVFSVSHSDFRPLAFVDRPNIESIMNDNYFSFIEYVRILMKSKGLKYGSSIVVLSSISSIRAMKAKMAFCSAKAAVDAAVRCLAVELGTKHIRVNSILKGGVDVDFNKKGVKDVASITDNEVENKQVLGISDSFEIANMVAFMLSDAVTTMTGSSVVLDGGYSL